MAILIKILTATHKGKVTTKITRAGIKLMKLHQCN